MLTRTKSGNKDHHHRRPQTHSSCSSDRSCSGDVPSDTSLNSPPPSSGSDGQLYWDISLDRDLLQTIAHFYPQWFSTMADQPQDMPSIGSPRAVVDDASLLSAMDRNKESLKVKLLLRRPITQLVEQGILPSPKSSPEFYERSKKLERLRMENFLKRQIQRRPDRQSLIEQHILEDTFVSPSLQGAERQLKKVRLADDLNDRLSHRPGPLELVKGNILLADERLAQAIKEGAIQFKATCEGEPVKHPPPLFHLEDPESSSDGTRSPPQDLSSDSLTSYSPAADATATPTPVHPIHPSTSTVLIACSPHTLTAQPSCNTTVHPITGSGSLPAALPAAAQHDKLTARPAVSFSIAAPTLTATAAAVPSPPVPTALIATTADPSSPPLRSSFASHGTSTPASVKSDTVSLAAKSRKKCKSKVQPKTRTIKFHEYKGPPSAQKSGSASAATCPSESSYELLLKQQQLFLQWQLEWQQKYPHIIMPAATQKQLQEQSQQETAPNGMSPGVQHQTVLISGSKAACVPETTASTPKHNANQSNDIHVQKNISNNAPGNSCSNNNKTNNSNVVPSNPSSCSASTPKLISRLEDLKVSDLKVQLKKRSLPVSGSKPQLLERLKPFTSEVLAALRSAAASADPQDAKSIKSNESPSPSSSSSADSHAKVTCDASAESAPEAIASGEVAMDVGDVVFQHNRSPHFTATSETVSLSAAPHIINNGFIIGNKDMMKLHPDQLEAQAKGQTAQYSVQGQPQQFQLQLVSSSQISQLQYPIQFQSQGPSIAIPLASIGAPQFQVITTMAQNQSASPHPTTSASRGTQQEPPAAHHRRKSASSCNSFDQSRPSSASVKASLAAFLQNQAAQQQQANLMSDHFVSGDQIAYPHVVLLPASPAEHPAGTKQQRAHSFSVPMDTMCHLGSQSRAGSLPSFPIARRQGRQEKSTRPPPPNYPPPNYEEATAKTVTMTTAKPAKRTSKKNPKSQALEDVLEILVKNGELPASAADEPETPTTPSCKPFASQQTVFSIEKDDRNASVKSEHMAKNAEQLSCQHQQQHQVDTALDLDLILNLQSLEEQMDFTHDADRSGGMSTSSWLTHVNNNNSPQKQVGGVADRRIPSADQNCDMSLSWMEVSPSDPNDWIAELNLAVDNENNKMTEHRSREVPSNDFTHCLNSYSQKNSMPLDRRSLFRPNLSPVTITSSCSAKDHDPILPNNMVGTVSNTEPLLDLFFDENEMRAHELGVWDRLDFAA